MAEKSLLPKGYRPLGDKTKFLGELKNLSPAQQELRMLMVPDKTMKDSRSVDNKTRPDIPKLKRLSDSISNGIQAQTNLRTITPYIKRAEQIWLTLLLKPNGMDQELLQYNTIDSDLKNAKLHGILLQKVKNYFKNEYPFEDTLSQIIKDVMFRTGSYPLLNLSHAAIDHMINGMAKIEGNESFKDSLNNIERKIRSDFFVNNNFNIAKNFGWIRKDKKNSINDGLESIFSNGSDISNTEYHLVDPAFKWTFTDNPMILKVRALKDDLATKHLNNMMGAESLDNVIDTVFSKTEKNTKSKVNPNNVGITSEKEYSEFLARMYPKRTYDRRENLSVRHQEYYTGSGRGVGVTFHVPSEACIPVYQNGNKQHPIGFILLTDPENGCFLKSTSDVSYYSSGKKRNEVLDRQSPTGSMNDIITSLKNVSEGRECNIDMDWAIDFVNGQLEKEIIESFLNGDKSVPVTISLTEANKKLYLARAFKEQGVRSIFVPAEYLTYFCLDYNEFGVGKSLVEEAKMIITRIAILDIADTAAQLLKAIPKSLLTIDLEEENFNPTELILQAREKYLNENPSILNFVGFTDVPIDRIIDGVKETLVRVKVNANGNPNIINPGFEEQHEERAAIESVDSDSRDKALNSLSSYFDLKRSWLEDSEQGNDFAIEALADQELLRNITIERSRQFSLFISDHFTKHINTNENLIDELVTTIIENKDLVNKPDQGKDGFSNYKDKDGNKKELTDNEKVKLVFKDFLNNLDITLPAPAFVETYSKLVDKLEAADKLVNGWKEIGVAGKLLKRTLKEMNLTEEDLRGNDGDDNYEYVLSIVSSVLRREAYKKLGVTIPFDEIVTDGKAGGMMTFINDATVQRENVVSFLEALFTSFAKGDKRIDKIAEKIKAKMGNGGEEDEVLDENNNPSNDSTPPEDSGLDDNSTPPENDDDTTPPDDDDVSLNDDNPSADEAEDKLDDSFDPNDTPKF